MSLVIEISKQRNRCKMAVKSAIMTTGSKPCALSHSTTLSNKLSGFFINLYILTVYQDVHVMMLVGFGFLMTFLKRHGFGSLGFTFLILCFVIEWSLLVNGWFSMIGKSDEKFSISIERSALF